jgi:hypothetical protein
MVRDKAAPLQRYEDTALWRSACLCACARYHVLLGSVEWAICEINGKRGFLPPKDAEAE